MKKILILSTLLLTLGFSSCDSYLDINENPNSPTTSNITSDMVMPAVEMNLAASYGDFLNITGGYYSQIYAHYFGTSNYVDYSQFQMSATRSSSFYTQMTQRVQSNAQEIREMAEEEEDWGTYLAATTLRAFAYQCLVDCYGEIPYTEALDESNLSPHYDDGLTIYEGIVAELDDALSKATSSSTVCTNFLYEGETATNWIRFANALKLRILMRMYDVQNVSSEVAALIAEDNFPTKDVTYTCWANEEGSYNPLYAEDFADGMQKNLALNLAISGTMQVSDDEGNVVYTDPRLEAFFDPNIESSEFFGAISGTNHSTAQSITANTVCRPHITSTSPVYLLTMAEVEFFKAEYYARTGNSSNAKAHYEAAIEASFSSAGVEGVEEYLERYPYDSNNYLECIGTQKWLAMSGTTTFEAYCEVRRLGYPTFGTKTGGDFYSETTGAYDASSYEWGKLYTPISVFNQVGSNQLLQRWPYPESSSSRNENTPTFPGYTSPIFWAE